MSKVDDAKKLGKDLVLQAVVGALKDHIMPKGSPRWPLRLVGLNRCIGGGIPRGRFIEIHGPSDAGKTTLLFEILRDIIALEEEELDRPQGKRILIMDHEGVMDLEYAEAVTGTPWGHVEDLKHLPEMWEQHRVIYMIPPHFEFDAKITGLLLRHKRVLMTCHDSIAAMTPRVFVQDKKGDPVDGLDDSRPAQLARLLGQWLPRWKKLVVDADATSIYTNHAKRKSIGHTQSFMPAPWETVGGENPKFYADIRIRVVGGKSDLHPAGKKVYLDVIRNKTSRDRNGKLIYHITGVTGYDRIEELMRLALEIKLIRWVDKDHKVAAAGSAKAVFLRTEPEHEIMTPAEARNAVAPAGVLHEALLEGVSKLDLTKRIDDE